MSRARMLLATIALASGLLAALAREPVPAAAADEIPVLELATWIRAQRPGLLLVDLRPTQDIAATGYLPGAQPFAEFDVTALAEHSIVVVYTEDEVAETAAATLRQQWNLHGVLRLQGGMSAWQEQVMFPQIRADAPARLRAEFDARAQLSRYFGGRPRVLETGAEPAPQRSRRGC